MRYYSRSSGPTELVYMIPRASCRVCLYDSRRFLQSLAYFLIHLVHQSQHSLAISAELFTWLIPTSSPPILVQYVDGWKRCSCCHSIIKLDYGYQHSEDVGLQVTCLTIFMLWNNSWWWSPRCHQTACTWAENVKGRFLNFSKADKYTAAVVLAYITYIYR